MAKKIYRTTKGRAIDMESLRRANEETIAAGNMKVNARGDELGKGGKVVRPVQERAKTHYTAPKQVAKTSIRPPVKETQKETPKADTNIKTREDGSQYKEVLLDDGSIETHEITPPKSKKKTTSKKKPTV